MFNKKKKELECEKKIIIFFLEKAECIGKHAPPQKTNPSWQMCTANNDVVCLISQWEIPELILSNVNLVEIEMFSY